MELASSVNHSVMGMCVVHLCVKPELCIISEVIVLAHVP